jgi:hypothetical protein
MRILALALVACGGGTTVTPSNTAPVTRPKPLEPLIISPAASKACPLRWNELDEVAPPRLPLHAAGTTPDECEAQYASDFEECQDCSHEGKVATGAHATHVVSGPGGTGRFWSWTLSIGERFACGMGSTVGWRHLTDVAEMIAPLQWFADLDGDGKHEVVVWHRVPWGSSELTNGLVPIVYAVTADDLVRRDDLAKPLRAKVAAMYRALAKQTTKHSALGEFIPCYEAIAGALE